MAGVDTETRMKAEGNQWKQREKGDILYKAIIIGSYCVIVLRSVSVQQVLTLVALALFQATPK